MWHNLLWIGGIWLMWWLSFNPMRGAELETIVRGMLDNRGELVHSRGWPSTAPNAKELWWKGIGF